ncbi:MAG: hypothetical protein JWP91_1285 [Fibrobacteres bacterium]|nr:hypothetical protein [Fibrobacterota bacterium]
MENRIAGAPAPKLATLLLCLAAFPWKTEAALAWPGCPDPVAADFKDVILVAVRYFK